MGHTRWCSGLLLAGIWGVYMVPGMGCEWAVCKAVPDLMSYCPYPSFPVYVRAPQTVGAVRMVWHSTISELCPGSHLTALKELWFF